MKPPDAADLDRYALFLDLDGTLAEIAAKPNDVTVDPATVATLASLSDQLGGALAIISGREIQDIDQLLTPIRFAIAGVHGAARRGHDGRVHTAGLGPDDIEMLANELASALHQHEGLLIERKSAGVAVHFRARPQLADTCERVVKDLVASHDGLKCQAGKMVYEVVSDATDKGEAIRAFLAEEPFAHRRPVFVGDDVTDEAGFAVVNDLDGVSIKIGDGATRAKYRLEGPKALKSWLSDLSLALAGAQQP